MSYQQKKYTYSVPKNIQLQSNKHKKCPSKLDKILSARINQVTHALQWVLSKEHIRKVKEYVFNLKDNTTLLKRDIIHNVSFVQLINTAKRKEVY